jgi:hypothetical protein
MKTASAVRREAANLAMEAARQRDRDGDPEGAGVLRDLAQAIRAIAIRQRSRDTPWRD